MRIEPHASVPVFLQIADHIRRAVAAGAYRPGKAVPSLRALAQQLAVNPNTVQRAYEALEREGLLEARKGLGMFVTQGGASFARRKSEADVIALFTDGIHAARAAEMTPEQIRGAFEHAWRGWEEHAAVDVVPTQTASSDSRRPKQPRASTASWRCWQ